MGQQQLILLVLVFIIVGIAAVVAINTFEQSRDASVKDAARNDMLSAINSAQKYYLAPESLGGGGGNFNGITFKDLTIDSVNTNASYSISGTGNIFTITAVNSAYDLNYRARAQITGSQSPEIEWEDL
ncbi:MAG: hypothetical protein U5J95_09870 [Balneolaceae bacterium]|nr:hypothetical protein [Balneolaceae bacterium]